MVKSTDLFPLEYIRILLSTVSKYIKSQVACRHVPPLLSV